MVARSSHAARGSHDNVEWRSAEDALALDLSLVEDVFRRLARRRRDMVVTKAAASPGNATSDLDNNATPIQHYYHPDMVFSKSDVLVALETSIGFLEKRPLLRQLHTALACVSLEKEGASVEGFVRYRVKERTLSFTIVHAKLLVIHTNAQRAIEFENQVQAFKEQVQAASPWCVRDWKSRCKKPSQYYKVHVLPVKPKTQKQLDIEQQVLAMLVRSVVNNAVQLALEKFATASTRPVSSKRSGRRKTPNTNEGGDESSDGRLPRQLLKAGTNTLLSRVRAKREQSEIEARRKLLRLQIFAPGIERTHLLSAAQAVVTTPSPPVRQLSTAQQQQTPAPEKIGEEGDSVADLDTSPAIKESRGKSARKTLLLLAMAEANGDPKIAERLLIQTIPHLGFQRASEQAQNLGLAQDDQWGLLKIWKSVYRNRSIQSLQSLLTK
uniref:Uncharacterized protein n=1 Tax=Globisporangium ultimum (strain ATCC 200006 / CBS 805.95 / DAOM BR144) TaxID=431595 RepID=K3WBY8_GLOUD